jgi:F-type H+-transporting ATPase subunit epsilon
MTITIRVLTPDRVMSNSSADELVLPGKTGQMGVLEDHTPTLTLLETGLLKIKLEGTWTPFLVIDGAARITREQVTIVAKDIEEFVDLELREVVKELEKAVSDFDKIVTEKDRIDTFQDLRLANARVQGVRLLSKKI